MEIFKKMADNFFDEERLTLKVVEELSELKGEVLVKRLTRKEGQNQVLKKNYRGDR